MSSERDRIKDSRKSVDFENPVDSRYVASVDNGEILIFDEQELDKDTGVRANSFIDLEDVR